jgi:hypothetical protein
VSSYACPCTAQQSNYSQVERRFYASPRSVLKAGTLVSINNISCSAVDRFLPHRNAIGQFIGSEVEWFADPAGNIVGIVAEGKANANWGYVVLRRDEHGKYRYWDLETRIDSRETARRQMVRIMEATQPGGQKCSPLVD